MSSPLSPDQWQQLESLVDALLDTPPERRAALFAEVSGGDPERRAELERLVAACERAYPLLDKPASERFAALVDTAPLEPLQLVAERYRITRELGRGGMATVYLAHDLKHSRDVALKVVRPGLVAMLGSGRFLREIQIAAQLRHPHIVPLFDSGEADSVLYYVMPYEPGQSLRERLKRDGPLPIDDVVVILRDICDALAHAHQHGVVHCDVKPDNILLSGRNALVTDFGVARAATEATGTAASASAGAMLGTPAYMAPEQVAADPRTDHRADIYAVGVMAYELLTGRQPLGGGSPREILDAQLTQVPEPVGIHRPQVPHALTELVMKCLEKQPAMRWQSADEMVRALEALPRPDASLRDRPHRWAAAVVAVILIAGMVTLGLPYLGRNRSAGTNASDSLSIGILPVRAASAGGDLNWLATGLEGQLPIALADVPQLDVRPTGTIEALVRTGKQLDSVAVLGNVDYLVGMVLSRSGIDSVLVALDLLEGGIRTVRVGNVRAPLDGQTTVESLTRLVAERLRPMLGSRVREQELESRSTDAVANRLRRRAEYERLLARARIDSNDLRGAERHLDSAVALFVQSERRDPSWPAPRIARAALSQLRAFTVLFRSGGADIAGVRRVFDQGIALIDSVLDKTPHDPIALAARGRLRWQRTLLAERDKVRAKEALDTAVRDLKEALSIDSSLVRAVVDLSRIHYGSHAYKEAADYAERAYRMDSYMEESDEIIHQLARSTLELNQDEDAARWCVEGRRRFPDNPAHHGCVIEVMAWGNGPTNADSAWASYREFERLTVQSNVAARAHYAQALAGVLAKSRGVPPDSAKAVLARARAAVAGSTASQTTRDLLLAGEAAVLYRLGDSRGADELFAQFRKRDPERAGGLSEGRMLRDYVGASAKPGTR